MKKLASLLLVLVLCLGLLPAAFATEVRDEYFYYFTDRNGNEMMAPKNAFATKVIEFSPGEPWTSIEEVGDVQIVLGIPTYDTGDKNSTLSLGKYGALTLGFEVAIYDGEGLDIYVFEVGGSVESTTVEVSNDLVTWYEVGTAEGKTAGIDLNGKVPEGSQFHYIRLTDTGNNIYDKNYKNLYGADIDAVSGLNVKAITSAWAKPEMDKAEAMNLIPEVLKNQDLTKSITRAEFAAVAVKVFENLSGGKAVPIVNNPFTDPKDVEVLKAYGIGAVNGTSATTFTPDALLNREQCATMLTRVFKRITLAGWTLENDSRFRLDYKMPARFADDGEISDYARDSVYFMAANGIINGVGGNKFAPKNTTTAQEAQGYANATREQALAIAVRMVENLG